MTRTCPRTIHVFLLLAALTSLGGCARDRATLQAGARFGAAAAALATTAEAELLEIRRQVIDLRAARYGLDQPQHSRAESAAAGAPLASALPRPTSGPPMHPPVDAGVETAHAEARLAGTRALATLGALLTIAAADADTRDPAARAIDTLRLHHLFGAGELAEAQVGALADLADAVARHTLASRRAAAVRRALLETESPVRDLATAIRADFDPAAHRWLTNLTNEHTEAQLLLERLEAAHVGDPDLAASTNPQLAHARALARRADHANTTAREAAERIRAAADAMLQAHAALIVQLRADQPVTLEDIDAFLDEAERLKLIWQILRGN